MDFTICIISGLVYSVAIALVYVYLTYVILRLAFKIYEVLKIPNPMINIAKLLDILNKTIYTISNTK